MSVRQQDVSSAMLSILKKMDMMVESTKNTYENSITILNSVESVMRNEVSSELKKQTSVLMSIESKLKTSQFNEATVRDPGKFKELLGGLSSNLEKIIKVVNNLDYKAGDKLNKFFTQLSESMSNLTNNLGESKAKSLGIILNDIGSNVLKFGIYLTLYSILAPTSIVGATLLGTAIRLLVKTTGEIPVYSAEGIETMTMIGWQVLTFGAVMSLYSTLALPAMIGAMMFGKAIGLLLTTAGTLSEERIKQIEQVSTLGLSPLKFGLSMVLFAAMSPLVLLGSTLFGVSIRLLLATAGTLSEERIKQIEQVSVLGLAPLKFAASMMLFAAMSPLVLLGSTLFGVSIRLLLSTSGIADKKKIEGIQDLVALGLAPLKFAASMMLFAAMSPLVLLGSTLFGVSIRLLLMSSGLVTKEKTEGLKNIISIGKGVLLYSLSMILFVAVSPIVLLGSALFGLSIRMLMMTSGLASKQNPSVTAAPLKLALGILLYSLSMIAVTALAPMVLIGTLIISASLFVLSFALNRMGNPAIRKGILSILIATPVIFILSMIMASVADPSILIGSLIISGSILLLSFAFQFAGNRFTQILKGSLSLLAISISIIPFIISMQIFSNSGISILDSLVASFSIGIIALTMFLAGKGFIEILKGSLAIAVASGVLILITYGISIFKKTGIDLMDVLTLGLVVGGLAAIMYFAGKGAMEIIKGSIAMILASAALFLISYSLVTFKEAKMTWEDAGILGTVVGGLGVVMGIAGLAAPFIIAGSIALGLAGLALLVISYALKQYKTVGWTKDDNVTLRETIKSVLGALSGTDSNKSFVSNVGGAIGQGLSTIVSLFSIGTIILASAAIWLMSEALIKYKTVGWDAGTNALLGDTISTVLNALQGQSPSSVGNAKVGSTILDTIVQFISAGSLMFAAASIWLLSEALIKFKTVKWTKNDTSSLSFTISEILKVITGAEEGGGLWGAITGAAKSVIGAAGSAGNATSLGLAGASIFSLSEGLLKWKSVGWGPGQTKNLTGTITSLLGVLTSDSLNVLDPEMNSAISARMSYFSSFAANIQTISNSAEKFAKVAENFEKIQQSMKLTKDSINGMDLAKLTLTDSLMKSLAIIAKNPEAMARAIENGIDRAFEDLIEAIKDLSGETKGNAKMETATSPIAAPTFAQTPQLQRANLAEAKMPSPPPINPEQLKQAFMSALAAYFGSNDIKVEVVR